MLNSQKFFDFLGALIAINNSHYCICLCSINQGQRQIHFSLNCALQDNSINKQTDSAWFNRLLL